MSKIQFQAYSLIVIIALTLLGVKTGRRALDVVPPKTQFEFIPMDHDPWTGIASEFDEETKRLLPSASLLLRYYAHEAYPYTCMAIVYGTDLGDFHQPEICLQGQGFKTVSRDIIKVTPKNGHKPFDAVALIMEGPNGPTAFLYWFASEATTATSLGNYQMKIFKDRLVGREVKPSAMIRLSTDINSSDKESIEQMAIFAGDFAPYLEKQFTSGK